MRARKRYGQHFLEPAWADKLVAAIGPGARDRFLEIGPGLGALTLRLAPRVAHLIAIDIDPAMVATLAPRLPANVTLVEGDFLNFDLRQATAAGPLRIAGNLPYYASSPILFKLLRAAREGGSLIDATLMVQREVGARLWAAPGTKDYGILAILSQLQADVRQRLALPPGAFRPAPRVHSALVTLEFHPPAVALRDQTLFQEMVRSMFTKRRKMLVNALAGFAVSRGLDARDALRRAAIDPRRRPETLQLAELAQLADVFAAG